MNKVQSARTIEALKRRGHLLVGYLLAGYPSRELFLDSIIQIKNAGVDILEIGFPSRNPVNDGQAIRDAHMHVDEGVIDDLEYWKVIRQTVDIPIWIMGYNEELVYNPRYLWLAQNGCADGFVLPGLSHTKRQELNNELSSYQCDVLGFVNSKMSAENIRTVCSEHSLVYLQLYVGITGTKVTRDEFEGVFAIAKEYPNTSVFAGFGIDTKERAEQLLEKGFDGVIIGTAFIKKQNESINELTGYIRHLKSGSIWE